MLAWWHTKLRCLTQLLNISTLACEWNHKRSRSCRCLLACGDRKKKNSEACSRAQIQTWYQWRREVCVICLYVCEQTWLLAFSGRTFDGIPISSIMAVQSCALNTWWSQRASASFVSTPDVCSTEQDYANCVWMCVCVKCGIKADIQAYFKWRFCLCKAMFKADFKRRTVCGLGV